jgi:hypothetical protein
MFLIGKSFVRLVVGYIQLFVGLLCSKLEALRLGVRSVADNLSASDDNLSISSIEAKLAKLKAPESAWKKPDRTTIADLVRQCRNDQQRRRRAQQGERSIVVYSQPDSENPQ